MDENLFSRPCSGDASSSPRKTTRAASALLKLLAALGIVVILIAFFLPAVRNGGARLAANRNMCANQLHQIALAIRSYVDAHHALPPLYTTDADGKPLHSWRTLILPYLEEQKLYDSVDLTKPWNDPANAEACKKSPGVYQCPAADIGDNRTTYLAVVTPGGLLQPGEPTHLSAIPNAQKTLMLIEADLDDAVPWMAPIDADEQIVMGIGTHSKLAHPGIMNGAFADSHVESLGSDLPADQRRAMLSTANQGESTAGAGN
jgi:hypothetical protein